MVDCLDSILNQTYGNLEHVVIDGASNDGTLELLQAHHAKFATLVSEPDGGIYDALNKGITKASGDVIGFLHADDVYAHPKALANIAAVFEADSSICAVYGDLQYVCREDVHKVVRYWKTPKFSRRRLAWGWMPPHPTLYVRSEWYKRIGGLDTSYKISADYFSILQLFSDPTFKAVHLPEVIVKMRLGGVSNRSIKSIVRKSLEDLSALRRTNVGAFGGIGALFWKNFSKLHQFR